MLAGAPLAAQTGEAQPEAKPPGAPAADAQGTRRLVSPGTGGKTLEIAAGPGSVFGKDELILRDYVDLRYGNMRLQADYVRYLTATKEAYAEGNVILDQGPARITAESLVYNIETGTGTFTKARGYAEPSYYFEAERVEKVSENELVLHQATFTACTQPIPYWSFKIGHGLIRLDDYAYMHNLRFKLGRVPVFYTPYLVWPVKSDRASGLLFPNFGYSQRSGTIISNAYYWAMRRNMDSTFYLDYMSLAGYGTGLEYRYVPTDRGRGYFSGYYIRDQVAKEENRPGVPVDRWVINYTHNQVFEDNWRMIANANFISDFDYYRDFERDLRLSTNPQALSNLFVTHNWGFYSLNLLAERREQLLSVRADPITVGESVFSTREESVVRWILPQVELRGRRQRLGRSPLFFGLEASGDYLSTGAENAVYGRVDLSPVLSSQLSPVPWMDLNVSLALRDTFYTRSQQIDIGCDHRPDSGDFGEGNGRRDTEDANLNGVFDAGEDLGCDQAPGPPGDFGEGNGMFDEERLTVVDDPLNRRIQTGGLTVIGPKLSRVFLTPGSSFSPQYKNTIEPQIRYTYQSVHLDTNSQIINFDQIDSLGGRGNNLTFALVSRLYAKRSASGLEEVAGSFGGGSQPGAAFVGGGQDPLAQMREAMRREQRDRSQAGAEQGEASGASAADAKKSMSTIEIASLEISQDYSLLGPLSSSAALNAESRLSAIRAALRFNPTLRTSFDLRANYDVLFDKVRDASLSANLRHPRYGFVDLTWSVQRDLETEALVGSSSAFDAVLLRNQIGLLGETSLLGRRLLVGMQINYELGDVAAGQPRLRDQRYRLGYNTQCCGFQFEWLSRNYQDSSQQEFRFLINLKGIGNVLDLQSGNGGSLPGTFPPSYPGSYQ
jgi:hypothetical protein